MSLTVDVELNGQTLSADVPEAMVLDVRRPLVGTRRHTRVEIPGRAGTVTFDEEPGDRVLDIEVDLQGDTFADRRDSVRRLARWAEVGTTARLVFDDEPDRYYDALLDNAPDAIERLRHGAATLKFAVGPYSSAIELTEIVLSATTNPDGDNLEVTDEVYAEPIIEITANGGTVTALTVQINDDALTWAGTPLAAGDVLTISAIADVVTLGANDDVDLTGAFDEDAVDMADLSGRFPVLLPGTNPWSISWTGSATSLTIVITWRERFY